MRPRKKAPPWESAYVSTAFKRQDYENVACGEKKSDSPLTSFEIRTRCTRLSPSEEPFVSRKKQPAALLAAQLAAPPAASLTNTSFPFNLPWKGTRGAGDPTGRTEIYTPFEGPLYRIPLHLEGEAAARADCKTNCAAKNRGGGEQKPGHCARHRVRRGRN